MLPILDPLQQSPYQASKWLKYPVLIDAEELLSLFHALGAFWIFPIAKIGSGDYVEPLAFVDEYAKWIEGLKQGKVPSSEDLKKILAAVFTDDLDSLWRQQVSDGKYIVKIRKPVLQVQAHFFTYSAEDGVFRSMSMGPNAIFWGLQFSYPQLYQEPSTHEFVQLKAPPILRALQLWVRNHTLPTPFFVGGIKKTSSIRLGKNCFHWISKHPQLLEQNLRCGNFS